MDISMLLLILIPIGGYIVAQILWGEGKMESQDGTGKKQKSRYRLLWIVITIIAIILFLRFLDTRYGIFDFLRKDSGKEEVALSKPVSPPVPVVMTIGCDGTTYVPPLQDWVTYILPSELDSVNLIILSAGETQVEEYGPKANELWVGINYTHTKSWFDTQTIMLRPPCTGQTKSFTLRPILQK